MRAVADGSAVTGSAQAGFVAWLRAHALARDIALSSGVALLLGLIRLGTPSFWVDEAATAQAVDWSFIDRFDGYHGLYYSIVSTWATVAGTSELALRLPSVFGTMLACAFLVVLAHRIFGGWVPLVSGLLLATSPFVVHWSQQARGYTMLLAVSLLATILLLRALEHGSRAAWALYGLAFAAVVVWHPVAGVLLAPAHVVLVAQRRERAMPHGLLAAALILLLAVPWAAQIALRSTGEGVAIDWLKAPSAGKAVEALLSVSGAAGVGAVLALAGLWMLTRAGRRPDALWLGMWAFAPFLVALAITIGGRPIYLDRYLLVAAPAFALLAAYALVGFGRPLRAVAVAAVVVATALGLVAWYSSSEDGNWRGEDWRGAVAYVAEHRAPGEAVVVAPWSAAPSARYYGVEPVDTSTARSIWVLTWSETSDDIDQATRRGLGFGDHRLVERTEFGRRVSAQLWRAPGE
jgi:mannosyltransferase